MSTTVHYSGTRAQKLAASLDDAKWYLGDTYPKAIAVVRDILVADATGRRKINRARFALAFAGVQGLPATAMMREAYNTLNGAI
jgi:hypothetical protein